jgi:hypothetical protein
VSRSSGHDAPALLDLDAGAAGADADGDPVFCASDAVVLGEADAVGLGGSEVGGSEVGSVVGGSEVGSASR